MLYHDSLWRVRPWQPLGNDHVGCPERVFNCQPSDRPRFKSSFRCEDDVVVVRTLLPDPNSSFEGITGLVFRQSLEHHRLPIQCQFASVRMSCGELVAGLSDFLQDSKPVDQE